MNNYDMVRYADEEEIVVPSGTRILDRIGTPEERKFLIAVMAEQLGIPASEATQPDVLAVIANAAQRTVQFGWQPGVHMHVQPFNETEDGPNNQKIKVKKWKLVDGEKAWKDSAERHRRNGVKFAIVTRPQPMSKEELAKEVQAMGMNPSDLAINACGVYAKVIVQDEFEIACMVYGRQEAFDSIPWAAGLYTGKKRSGRYWNDDVLPTGSSPKDVAIRRAHKRALMQSTLPLIPLDDKSEKARIGEFTEQLRREELHRHRRMAMPSSRPALTDFEEEVLSGPISSLNEVPEWDGVSPCPPELQGEPVTDNPFDDSAVGANAEKSTDYGALADSLTGNCLRFAQWAYGVHRDGDGPATPPQYNLLAGTIDKATDGHHTLVLSVLCRRFVDSGNPCSKNLAQKLLDFIMKSTAQKDDHGKPVKVDGKVVYVDNPRFRQDYVDCLKAIAQLREESPTPA